MQIRKADNDRIIEIAKKTFKIPVEIWAFGSRVKHTASYGSDLDLTVINKTDNQTFKNYITIFKENLKYSNIPIFVQVMDWDTIPENYKEEIKKNYEIYFKN